MDNFNQSWCVIYTKPRHEKKVVEQLLKLGLECFLPTIKTFKTWSDRKKYIDIALFPSYVFVKIKRDQDYFNSLDLDGVMHYVRVGREIAKINDTVIHNIKLIANHQMEGVEVSSEYLQPGKTLFIKEGIFAGFRCEVIQHKGQQKILVRIEILQRSILFNVLTESLMPVSMVYGN